MAVNKPFKNHITALYKVRIKGMIFECTDKRLLSEAVTRVKYTWEDLLHFKCT